MASGGGTGGGVTSCRAGQVYLLDYDAMGLEVPEMVKERLVVVVSPQTLDRKRGCATVIPLSTTAPRQLVRYNVPLSKDYAWVRGRPQLWAKCDMIYTPALERLRLVERADLDLTAGQNHRPVPTLSAADLKNIRLGVGEALGLDPYLDADERAGFRTEMRDRILKLLKRRPKRAAKPPAGE